MDITELHKKYEKFFVEVKGINLDGFKYINHKPHTYTVGSKHVDFSARRFNGKVNMKSIRSGEIAGIRCAEPGCDLTYDQHTYDILCFCEIPEKIERDDMIKRLGFITKELKKDKVSRIIFGIHENNSIKG